MSWPKGKTKPKTGGRQLGSPNKRTLMIQDALYKLGCDVPKSIVELLPSLSPDKKADVLLDLMSYLYPKRKAVELTSSVQTVSIEQNKNFFLSITSDPETMKAAEIIAERLASGEQRG